MHFKTLFAFLALLCFVQINHLEASYHCGIRKHSFVQLVHRGYNVQEGEWSWHVALFHKTDGNAPKYACGGTLLDEKHILTAAHCAVNRDTEYPLSAASFELHFGQRNLSEITRYVQIRDVSKVHIHSEYSTHWNDVAVLVMRLPVEYTAYVIPICMDQKADIDLRNLQGQRGWITGWGTTESGVVSDILRTASMPVVNYLQCLSDDRTIFGHVLNPTVFCAGDRNGTSPGTGDSGGGMYFSEGDRWVLRGIVSFGKADEVKAEVDTSKYTVFVNVQRFLTWIKEIMAVGKSAGIKGPKRISEQKCDTFKGMVLKRPNGVCSNSRSKHTVSLIDTDGKVRCSGVLVDENYILTAGHCIGEGDPVKVQVEAITHDILNITRHPQYKSYDKNYDLAVVKLNTSVSIRHMTPACLATNWTENLYDKLFQTGFQMHRNDAFELYDGATYFEFDENQVISTEECNNFLNAFIPELADFTPRQLCVKNRNTWAEDVITTSGCPLQYVNSQSCVSTVVGIFLGKKTSIIDMYTRVAYHLDWIEQTVWDVDSDIVEPPMLTTTSPRFPPDLRFNVEFERDEPCCTTVNNDFVFPDD